MNRSDIQGTSGSNPAVSGTANTRLSGSWLHIARAVWLVLVVPSLGLCIASLLVSYQQLLPGPFLHQRNRCSPALACLSVGLPL